MKIFSHRLPDFDFQFGDALGEEGKKKRLMSGKIGKCFSDSLETCFSTRSRVLLLSSRVGEEQKSIQIERTDDVQGETLKLFMAFSFGFSMP